MSKRFTGSIDIDTIAEAVKDGHASIKTGNNGRRYAGITIWENDGPDQYGNTHSLQFNKQPDEKAIYFGKAKPPEPKPEVQAAPAEPGTLPDFPF
jgi:hypothetical protein